MADSRLDQTIIPIEQFGTSYFIKSGVDVASDNPL